MPAAKKDTILLRPYLATTDGAPCLDIWRAASEAGHPFLGAQELNADEQKVRDEYLPVAENTVAVYLGQRDSRAGDARIVGFIALLGNFVGGLFVHPDFHRRGVGRLLLEDAAKHRGSLSLEVYERNSKAQAFYRALGFQKSGWRNADDQGRPFPLITLSRD